MKRSAGLLASAVCATALLVGSLGGHSVAADKKYTIYLSNNFVGNDWRQQMERVAAGLRRQGTARRAASISRSRTSRTPSQAQINSLNNIIRAKPDAILVDAGSAEALNPTIKKACDAGIVVISFDQVVTEPCAYALESDWNRIPAVLAEWMAKQLNGKGKVFVDRGLAGAPISAQLENGYMDVLKKYPGIEVIGNYNGELRPRSGAGRRREPSRRPSGSRRHPDPGLRHRRHQGAAGCRPPDRPGHRLLLQRHGRRPAPQTAGAKCILGSNPAYLSSEAIKLAVDILDGKPKPADRHILVNGDFLATDPFKSELYPDAVIQKIEIGKNAFPDGPPGLTLPITPTWVEITAKEAAGS